MTTNTNYALSLSGLATKDKTEVGIPALELAELLNANVPIPAGFVITQNALEYFAFSTQLDQKVKQLQHMGSFSESTLTKLILESDIPKEIYDDISREYTSLSGISNVWMRIRAGLYDASGSPLTFIDEKEINEVKGFDALELEIKKVWAKLLIIDQKYDSLGSFVIVQKLIPAEVSGVILTQDLNNKETDHILIKAMFGELNEDYTNTFDNYTFSKVEEKIIDRAIIPQKNMLVRSNKNDFGYEEVEIAEKWQMKQKLGDKYIEDLGYLGDYLENVFTKPQEVKWVFQAGKIWINYVKPVTERYLGEQKQLEEEIQTDYDKADELVNRESESYQTESVDIDLPDDDDIQIKINNELLEDDEDKKSDTDLSQMEPKEKFIIESVKSPEILPELTLDNSIANIKEVEQEPDIKLNLRAEAITRDVLVAGVGNSKGIIDGKIVFNRDESTDKDILMLPTWDDLPKTAAAIIVEDMLSINSEIPLIYGAELASKILREGEYIKLDTDTGFIFESDMSQKLPEIKVDDENIIEEISQDEKTGENLENISQIEEVQNGEVELPGITPVIEEKKVIRKKKKVVENKKEDISNSNTLDENIPTAIKVIAHVSSHVKDEIKYSDGFLVDLPHADDYISSKEKVDYKSIKNLIYNFTLPFAKNPKNILIYNIFDVNPALYIKNADLLLVQCEAVHKLRSKENLRQLHVALPKFKTLKQLREFRRSISAAGLRRSTTFKVYIKVAYSSNIFELPTYLEDRFDGVIVNVEALHNSLYSSDKKFIRVSSTLIKALAQINKECKTAKVPMILDLKGVKMTKSILDKLDPFINYAISVNPKFTEYTKKHIMDLEKKSIFK